MRYGVDYSSHNPEVVKHGFCCRCQMPTENSPVGVGQIPAGPNGAVEKVNHIVLCLMCLELLHADPRTFWDTGWGL